MPEWFPKPFWKNMPVVVLGGGESVKGFNFDLLKPVHIIGVNKAYTLGKIVDMIVFGDSCFWDKYGEDIQETYFGFIVTNHPTFLKSCLTENIFMMKREPRGIHRGALGWNGHTGASALNLALVLGGNPVYLLGFDFQGKHWHEGYTSQGTTEEKFQSFLSCYPEIKADAEKLFPNQKIMTVGKSRLTEFDNISMDDFIRRIR